MLKNSCAYVALACLLLVPEWSAAQTTGATIVGTVLDETRAALPGATVTIRHIDTDSDGSS